MVRRTDTSVLGSTVQLLQVADTDVLAQVDVSGDGSCLKMCRRDSMSLKHALTVAARALTSSDVEPVRVIRCLLFAVRGEQPAAMSDLNLHRQR